MRIGTVPHRIPSPLVEPWSVVARWSLSPKARAGARRAFEEAIARRQGVRHVVLTSSARVALWAILRSLDLPAGAQIWMPVNTYDGLLPGIHELGLSPAFADVGADANMNVADLERRLRGASSGGVLLATHMWGLPCDLPALRVLAEKAGLTLIEDCAHTFAVDAGGVLTGLTGRAAILSFQSRKAINCLGGGAIVTQDAALAARARALIDQLPSGPTAGPRQLGTFLAEQHIFFSPLGYPATRMVFEKAAFFDRVRSGYSTVIRSNRGGSTGMNELQAMLGLAQVATYDQRQERLARLWRLYDEALAHVPELQPAPRRAGVGHGRYMYVVQAPDPALLAARLWREGVGTARGEGLVPCLGPRGYPEFPGLQRLRATALQVPFADGLTDDEAERVASAITAAMG